MRRRIGAAVLAGAAGVTLGLMPVSGAAAASTPQTLPQVQTGNGGCDDDWHGGHRWHDRDWCGDRDHGRWYNDYVGYGGYNPYWGGYGGNGWHDDDWNGYGGNGHGHHDDWGGHGGYGGNGHHDDWGGHGGYGGNGHHDGDWGGHGGH
ncbi:hypothetical protein [Streptomyces sp. NPDC051211]|uniref:hypothetical protein n=1 Tax=Streptomyces sp. NPDC051211 TaxID=3154643 RepID=UPI0034503C5A